MIYLEGDGSYSLGVVGESHYQSALIDIAGRHTPDGHTVHCQAILYPEDDNPFDANAVRVEIGGDAVGYIARDDAPHVRLFLPVADRAFVDAVIRGGRTGQHYGVWLDFPTFEEEDDDGEEMVKVMEPDLVYMPGIGLVTDYFPRWAPKSEAPPPPPAPPVRHPISNTSMPWYGTVILLLVVLFYLFIFFGHWIQ